MFLKKQSLLPKSARQFQLSKNIQSTFRRNLKGWKWLKRFIIFQKLETDRRSRKKWLPTLTNRRTYNFPAKHSISYTLRDHSVIIYEDAKQFGIVPQERKLYKLDSNIINTQFFYFYDFDVYRGRKRNDWCQKILKIMQFTSNQFF